MREHACVGSECAISWQFAGRQQSGEGAEGAERGPRRPAAQRVPLVVTGVFGGREEGSGTGEEREKRRVEDCRTSQLAALPSPENQALVLAVKAT